MGRHVDRTATEKRPTLTASSITADVAACATVTRAFAYCCLAQQNSESECSSDATGGSGEIPLSGGTNDFARGHCECSTVVFVTRLGMDAVLVGTVLIDGSCQVESGLRIEMKLTWAVQGSLGLSPKGDLYFPVFDSSRGRTLVVVSRSNCCQESLSRLTCRSRGSCRSLFCENA